MSDSKRLVQLRGGEFDGEKLETGGQIRQICFPRLAPLPLDAHLKGLAVTVLHPDWASRTITMVRDGIDDPWREHVPFVEVTYRDTGESSLDGLPVFRYTEVAWLPNE